MISPVIVFVNAFNHLTFVRDTVEFLIQLKQIRVVVIDNCSSYPPLVAWYKTCPCEVVRLNENLGHRAPWTCGAVEKYAQTYYAVTDSDLDLKTLPLHFLEVLLQHFTENTHLTKCGLALRIDDLPDEFILKEQVLLWEREFWKNEISENVFEAPIDTTFAVYSKDRSLDLDFFKAARIAGPLTVSHRPWYWQTKNLGEEDLFYIASTKVSPGWKKVLLHSLNNLDLAQQLLESTLSRNELENWAHEKEVAANIAKKIDTCLPERILYSDAVDGSLVFLGARQLRRLGKGSCVTYAGGGERYQTVRRLLLGLPVDVRVGNFTDEPANEEYGLVIFSGHPNAIQFVEYNHMESLPDDSAIFTGLGRGSSLPYFLRT